MSAARHFYMLFCGFGARETYFTAGVSVHNIPFEEYNVIKLYKFTWRGFKHYKYNLTPAFHIFQLAWRRRHKWLRNPRRILARQIYGLSVRPPPFLEGITRPRPL
jgi:hypothetical protein